MRAPPLPYTAFLYKVRGYVLFLCQSKSRIRGALLTEVKIKKKLISLATSVRHTPERAHSLHYDTAGNLKMNLIFYSKRET